MKLIKIKLNNFGIYSSNHELPLTSSNKNKLTLIIGKNGAGKTTLLNAIKTAFYGPLLFKVRSFTPEYQAYINGILNKDALKLPDSQFSVEVSFISNIFDADGHYTIKRSWSHHESKLSETVSVYKNKILLSADLADDFLNILYQSYPVELFDLLFFDGEKVDQLSILNQNTIDVMETAFNLNLYKSLKIDLEKYATNKLKSTELNQLEHKKTKLIQELSKIKEEIQVLNLEKADYELNIATNNETIKKLSKIGFKPLEDLDDSKIKQQQKNIDELNRNLKQLATDILPYSILKSELRQLTTQLEKENTAKNFALISNELKTLNTSKISAILNDIDESSVTEVINTIVEQYKTKSDIVMIHDINNEQYDEIKRFKKDISKFKFTDYLELSKQIEIERHKLDELKSRMLEMQTQEYKTNLDLLMNAHNTVTELNSRISQLNLKIAENNQVFEVQQIELQDLDTQIWKHIKTANVDTLLVRINNVLHKYIAEIKSKKIEHINIKTLNMFNNIIRKSDFIKTIDFNDYSIIFKDFNGNTLNHSNLSAGERQIFTLSLFVSILNTTERITPLVFDSLLGRLDQKHKIALLNNLMNNVSGQIIILATDSEIDEKLINFLNPWIEQIVYIDLSSKDEKIQIEGVC